MEREREFKIRLEGCESTVNKGLGKWRGLQVCSGYIKPWSVSQEEQEVNAGSCGVLGVDFKFVLTTQSPGLCLRKNNR